MTIKIGDSDLTFGEKRQYLYPLGRRHDGTTIGVPLMGIQGEQAGPVLGMATGLHGDTFEGPEALKQLFAEINSSELRGSIIFTPHANMPAYEAYSRTGWIDHADMNRSFPGKENGNVTEKASNMVVNEIIEQSDFFLNFQGGGLGYDLYNYVGYLENGIENNVYSIEFAKAFGVPVLYNSVVFPGVLRLEAFKRDIPALLVEIGAEGRCSEEKVKVIKRGIKNILRYLGMLNGDLEGLPNKYFVTKSPPEGEFLYSPLSGFLRSNVKVGDLVRKNDVLGEIIDVFGNNLITIKSPNSGMVLIARTVPSIRIGDWTYAVVDIVKKV